MKDTFRDLFSTQQSDADLIYHLDKSLNGGFGGTNGGVLAAICVDAARSLAINRVPIGIDARFVRNFPPGPARVCATPLNIGRSLTTISVDISRSDGKLATRGTVSFVNASALEPVDVPGITESGEELLHPSDGRIWRQPAVQEIPLITTFRPRQLGKTSKGIVTASDTIWKSGSLQEAACIAADLSVGPPVAAALKGRPLAMPNPDLSLRFCRQGITPAYLISTCQLAALDQGLATTILEVRDQGVLVATGISSTTCLRVSS
jgi:acyl-coenzyme A thioesterase PaaI-like protein